MSFFSFTSSRSLFEFVFTLSCHAKARCVTTRMTGVRKSIHNKVICYFQRNILDARPRYAGKTIPLFVVRHTSTYVVVHGFFCISVWSFSLTEYDLIAGHQKPEKVPSKTETRKEETGPDFGKLAD